jgi:Uma2 family endonuclease
MGMPVQDTTWTATMARALPDDGNRHEVLDGELFVSPSPSWSHQSVVGRLFIGLDKYVRQHALGWVVIAPADIEFSPSRLLQPDIFVVPNTGSRRPADWSEAKALLLAVEVLSPGSAHADRLRKRRIYQTERVPEYWIVDPDARVIERWRPDDDRPEILSATLFWRPRGDAPAFEIHLPAFFASALD